jgi:hypothetical protein
MVALADRVSAPRSRVWPAHVATWCGWALATTVGWMLGCVAVLLLQTWTTGAADALVHSTLGSAVLGGIVGLGTGLAQWLLLRRALAAAASPWVPVNVAAWAVGWAVGQAITDALLDDYWLLGLVPGGLLLAALVGVGPWLLLRRLARRASWWLPASLLGWSAAGVMSMYGGAGLFALGLAAFVGPVAWLIAAAPGAFAGLVTGAALLALPPRATSGG